MKRIIVWIVVIFALIAGLFIGSHIKDLARSLLFSLLDDEIKASTPCHLELESMDISFVTLSVEAKNASMVCEGQQKMLVKKVKASFSLRRIFDRYILFNLDLIDGVVDGAGPESETFRFIYYLAEPIPPERNTPDRWRLKLMKMNVSNVSFSEKLGEYVLEGEGGFLSFRKDSKDVITLEPGFTRLFLRGALNGSHNIELGDIRARIISDDDKTEIESIRTAYEDLWTQLKGRYTDASDSIDVSADYHLSTPYLQLPEWLQCTFDGSAQLKGKIEDLSLKGGLKCPLEVSYEQLPRQYFENFEVAYSASAINQSPLFEITALNAASDSMSISLAQPLQLQNGILKGSLEIWVKDIAFAEEVFRDLRAQIDLNGSISDPEIKYAVNLGSFQNSAGLDLSNLQASGTYHSGLLEAVVKKKNRVGALDLEGEAKLRFSRGEEARIESAKLKLIGYSLPIKGTPVFVDADMIFSGPLRIEEIEGAASGKIIAAPFEGARALTAELKVSRGKAALSFRDSTAGIQGRVDINDLPEAKNVNLQAQVTQHGLDGLAGNNSCLKFAGQLKYSFDLKEPLRGNGEIELAELGVGCDENAFEISSPLSLRINDGAILLSNLEINTRRSAPLNMNGTVSLKKGFNLSAVGTLNLNILLPFLPSFDDLNGQVEGKVFIEGPLDAPLINGNASLDAGHFSIASEGINASSITGRCKLEGDRLYFSELRGELNGGSFNIEGYLVPKASRQSALRAQFEKVVLEPVQDLVVILSGSVNAAINENGRPLLEGAIEIDTAQYQKNIDVRGLLELFTGAIFGRKEAYEATLRSVPDLDLKLSIKGRRNIYVFMNWFGAELSADISVNGPVYAPLLNGGLSTISGWLGFRNRRFVVSAGSLSFKPPSLEPHLDLVAETKIYSAIGTPVSVFLEIHGPSSRPIIQFSSDQGLAQQDIFSLLATGHGANNTTVVDSVGRDLEKGSGLAISGFLPFLPMRGLLDELTRIDNFYFEPELDSTTGLVEPVAIATKRLGHRLEAVGEIGLGENRSISRASLVYDLTPKLNVAGYFDAETADQKNALGADLRYTIFSKLGQAVKIKFKGNNKFSSSELMKGLKLSEAVSIKQADLPVIVEDFKEFYVKEAYRQVEVETLCKNSHEYCTELLFQINEGSENRIAEIEYRGDDPQSVLGQKMPNFRKHSAATQKFLDNTRDSLVSALRNEGYISARIDAHYEDSSEPDNPHLVLHCAIGKPVTFIFQGNTVFSSRAFLDSINLFGRRIPFGMNTVNLLIENMELLYRKEGYLYVDISKTEVLDPESGRITYIITINEGSRALVEEVLLEGNKALSTDNIREAFKKAGEKDFQDMFNPDYVVSENIKGHVEFLKSYYVQEGYPDVAVDFRIEVTESEKEVNIIYTINEGASQRRDWLRVKGLPSDVQQPKMPTAPYSIVKANEYIQELLKALNEAAYLSPILYSQSLPDGSPVRIFTLAGAKTYVDRIEIEGNVVTSQETILSNILVKEGDAWDPKKIQESKRRLLKTGLFSNVDVSDSANGSKDKRALRFLVKERPMQTLQIGTGLNSEYGFHLFSEGTDLGLFQDGRSLSLRLDAFYDPLKSDISQGIADLRYLDPTFAGSDISFTEDLRYVKQKLANQEFNLDRTSLSTSFYQSAPSGLTLSAAHTIFQENLTDVAPGSILSPLDHGIVDISSIAGTLRYDQRDSALLPTTGFLASIDASIASRYIASDANYYTLGGRLSYLIPFHIFDRRFVFGMASRLASAWTFDDTEYVPISQRFYAGGRTSVRGFRENSLGPTGEGGDVIGGDLLSVSNFQLNYLMTDSFSLHSFVDLGNVFLKGRGVEFKDLRKGTGLGIDYLSPVGQIGFDLGFPLDRERGESAYRIYFTVGTLF